MVGLVIAFIGAALGGPALRGGHHAERGSELGHTVLLGPVVQRVPLEVVRVDAFGVPLGEREVDGGDVGPAYGQDLWTVVRRFSDESGMSPLLDGFLIAYVLSGSVPLRKRRPAAVDGQGLAGYEGRLVRQAGRAQA